MTLQNPTSTIFLLFYNQLLSVQLTSTILFYIKFIDCLGFLFFIFFKQHR